MSRRDRIVLTVPPVPMDYGSCDNTLGDLIVTQDDIITNDSCSYRVLGLLGRGQFGHVYQVADITQDPSGHVQYALKITKSKIRLRQQAQHEIQILSVIQQHASRQETQNISTLIKWFIYRDHICILQEKLSIDLYSVIMKRNFRGLSLALVQVVLKQILGSLVILQKCGIIHSDIKPENILLADGVSSNVKLIDFGSSRLIQQPCSSYIQSRYYRAPEVVLGLEHDFKIDIWSLGCVAFELFLGMPLFPGQSEAHLLNLIVAMLGPIPDSVLSKASRLREFYTENNRLKTDQEVALERERRPVEFTHYFTYDNLDDIVYQYEYGRGNTQEAVAIELRKRSLLLDLLKRMLALDPAERCSAEEALQHSFITTNLSSIQ